MPLLASKSNPQQLYLEGPIVAAEIYQTPALVQLKSGQSVNLSQPYVGKFLIDTGASHTCIKPHIAEQLSLKQISIAEVGTPNLKSLHPVYVAGLRVIVGQQAVSFDVIRVTAMPLHGQGIDGLIGRDILLKKWFSYIGFVGEFLLAT